MIELSNLDEEKCVQKFCSETCKRFIKSIDEQTATTHIS